MLLALVAGLLGRFAWPLDLFSHFRAQYAVLLVLFACVLAVRRRHAFAAIAAVGALVSAVPLSAYVRLPATAAEADAALGNFRLVSFNIWFRNDDLERVAQYLEGTRADVVVLQELSLPKAMRLQPLLPSFQHAFLNKGQRYTAVVFSRWPIVAGEHLELSEGGVKASRVALAWSSATITLLGVHLRWPMGPGNSRLRNADLQGLARVAGAEGGPTLVAGDFNVTPWSAHFQQALATSGMSDCTLGHALAPTWPALFPPLGISIDHCLASRHWRAVSVRTGPYLGSDHRPLVVDLQLQQPVPERLHTSATTL